jgi:hypothetical protein
MDICHFQKFSICSVVDKPYGSPPGGKILTEVGLAEAEDIKIITVKIRATDRVRLFNAFSMLTRSITLIQKDYVYLILKEGHWMATEQKDSFSRIHFLLMMIGLIGFILIDTSIVKVYDLIDKNFMPAREKVLLFSVISFACLFLESLIVYYLRNSFLRYQINFAFNSKILNQIFFISLGLLTISFGYLTLHMIYYNSYFTSITIIIILISYIVSSFFLLALLVLFVTWYRSNRNSLVLLYSVSMVLILFNLLLTAAYSIVSINDRPDEIRRFVGGSMNISSGKYYFLYNVYTVSSILSFVSIWITTALLMKNYKDRLAHALKYWAILSLPLIYYSINYSYRYIFGDFLTDYLTVDPLTVSIILTAFLSLSRPIGGLTFGVVFWRISKHLRYEKRMRTYMIITGWGILLLFATNQATSQIVVPYPPFGLATCTGLILASYLMSLGIYNSARLVSINADLRRSIYKHAVESRLLNLIGTAEMDREVQKTVTTILQDKNIIELQSEVDSDLDLDEEELKKHLNFVIKEVRKTEDK